MLFGFMISNFSYRSRLQLGDAFVGYQEDTPAAVVFQAYHQLKAEKQLAIDNEMSEEQKDEVKLQNLLQ